MAVHSTQAILILTMFRMRGHAALFTNLRYTFAIFNSMHPLFTKCCLFYRPRKDGSPSQACLLRESNLDPSCVRCGNLATWPHRQPKSMKKHAEHPLHTHTHTRQCTRIMWWYVMTCDDQYSMVLSDCWSADMSFFHFDTDVTNCAN